MSLYNYNGEIIDNPYRSDAVIFQMYSDTAGAKADMQGCCTDGKYIYFAVPDRNTIYKYEILTGTVTSATYTSGALGHANSMTYNPTTEKIYVCTMDSSGTIAVVNSSTLAVESTFVLKDSNNTAITTSGIAYDRKNNRYIASSGNNYYFFDSSFAYVSTMAVVHPSYTFQGLETDGEFILRPMWDSTNNKNFIGVYDFDGNQIKLTEVPSALEIEDVAFDWDGNYYIGINVPSAVGWKLYYAGIREYINTNAVLTLCQITNE